MQRNIKFFVLTLACASISFTAFGLNGGTLECYNQECKPMFSSSIGFEISAFDLADKSGLKRSFREVCSAVKIAPKLYLTSAHCMRGTRNGGYEFLNMNFAYSASGRNLVKANKWSYKYERFIANNNLTDSPEAMKRFENYNYRTGGDERDFKLHFSPGHDFLIDRIPVASDIVVFESTEDDRSEIPNAKLCKKTNIERGLKVYITGNGSISDIRNPKFFFRTLKWAETYIESVELKNKSFTTPGPSGFFSEKKVSGSLLPGDSGGGVYAVEDDEFCIIGINQGGDAWFHRSQGSLSRHLGLTNEISPSTREWLNSLISNAQN